MIFGIDAGGTLIKVAYAKNDTLQFTKFPIAEVEKVASWVNEHRGSRVCVTGGKAGVLISLLDSEAKEIVEFEATHLGVKFLLERMGRDESSYLVTNVGTGTSIHCIENNRQERIGGTGVGGGTLLGLSHLLTGVTD